VFPYLLNYFFKDSRTLGITLGIVKYTLEIFNFILYQPLLEFFMTMFSCHKDGTIYVF